MGECRTGAKSVCEQKCVSLYPRKRGRTHRLIHIKGLFKVDLRSCSIILQ